MEELELTYLVKNIPDGLWDCPSDEVVDKYIPARSNHPIVRLRKCGEKLELTKKEPVDADDSSHQLEQTIPLTPEEYAALAKIPAKVLSKKRHYYPYRGKTIEIDVFTGDLVGLVLADVEFETIEEKNNFSMPDFCLADVTQEVFIAGGRLAGKKIADITGELERFEYEIKN